MGPVTRVGELMVTVFMGELGSAHSPATTFTPIVGAEASGTRLHPGQLLYVAAGREHLDVAAAAGSRMFLLGGRSGSRY